MQHYHLEVEGIDKYINMLEDSQKQAGHAWRTISDETLLLFDSTVMLTTESYPRTNNNWEDRYEEEKTWADWKTAYNRAHAKACVKAQAIEGSDKSGAANKAERVLTTSTVGTKNGGDEVGMKALEGCFYNLAAVVINEKSVLVQLVTNNSKLAATNEDLVAMVKNLANEIKISKEKPHASRKREAAGHQKER